jgi:hypothetical protein
MVSSPFLLGFSRLAHAAFETIVVDRASGEKRFVMTNLSKATPPGAAQGRQLPWLWCSTAEHLLIACRTDRRYSGLPNDLIESRISRTAQ